MVEVGCGRCKRAPRQISTLNECLCGIVVDPSRIGVVECRQPGCETQWESLYNVIRKVAYKIYSIILSVYPSNRCQRSGFARLVRHLGMCRNACRSDALMSYFLIYNMELWNVASPTFRHITDFRHQDNAERGCHHTHRHNTRGTRGRGQGQGEWAFVYVFFYYYNFVG